MAPNVIQAVFGKKGREAAMSRFAAINLIYKIAIVGSVFAVIGVGGYGVYRWHRVGLEWRAQKSFSECLQTYKDALSAQLGSQEKQDRDAMASWEEVEVAAKIGYEQHARSLLAPYFLALQAEAMLFQEKREQALDVLNRAISSMASSSDLYSLYCMKRALMRMDGQEASDVGLQELDGLAHDKKNIFRDSALYYLGLFYWSRDEQEKARMIWRELIDEFPAQGPEGSSWTTQAQVAMGQEAS